jgi:hypothetical protein
VSDYKPDIWKLQAQLNVQGLIEALEDDDPSIRKRAAAALRALDAYEAIPPLKDALERESDPETRSNILSALAILQESQDRRTDEMSVFDESAEPPPPTEAEKLIEQLKYGTEEEIIVAAHALGELGDKTAVSPLVVLFNYPKTGIKVRLAAAEALINLESAPVEVALLGALHNKEWRKRRNGAAILGQLKAVWAIEPLAHALEDEHEIVRKTAYAALKHIGTPEASAALKAAYQRAKERSTQKKMDQASTSDGTTSDDHDEAEATSNETYAMMTHSLEQDPGPLPDTMTAPLHAMPEDSEGSESETLANVEAEAVTDEPPSEKNTLEVPATSHFSEDAEALPDTPTSPLKAESDETDVEDIEDADDESEDSDDSDETSSKIVWPARNKPPKPDPSIMVTKPFDPSRIEEANRLLDELTSDDE